MGLPMRPSSCAVVIVGAIVAASAFLGAQDRRDGPIPHDSGQSVAPAFEGWFQNPDGTFSLSFGYFNRNYRQELNIPTGPNNRLEPGSPDQGQPTAFLPRRHTGVFTVVVPKDFGTQKLVWTVTANGQTQSVPGHLRPEWEIDALKEVTSGNTPPVIKFAPAGRTGQGPTGVSTSLDVTFPAQAVLAVWASDDDVRKREAEGRRGPAVGVTWSKFRGAGRVAFSETSPRVEMDKATTTATFSEPGEYTLRVLAWDSSGSQGSIMAGGFQCCWTNGYVRINVKAAPR